MTVRIEKVSEEVRALRLDRPERLNAIDYPLVSDLHDALDELSADDFCKVVILTGNGRASCAGLDLADWGNVSAPGSHRHMRAGMTGQAFLANLVQHIRATPQVLIAAVNGPAVGGGLALALACDLRIAGESATMCSAFIKTGLTGTDVGVTYFLPRLIGAARAFDMILTGRTIDATEAERIDLVSRVVPDDRLWDEATGMAETIAKYTSFGLRNTKEVMWLNLDVDSLPAAIALENRNQELAIRDDEVRTYMRDYSARHQRKTQTTSRQQPS
jgi:enoyl-CoA hydratase